MSETLIQNELNNLSALKESIAAQSCIGNTTFFRLGEGNNAPQTQVITNDANTSDQ